MTRQNRVPEPGGERREVEGAREGVGNLEVPAQAGGGPQAGARKRLDALVRGHVILGERFRHLPADAAPDVRLEGLEHRAGVRVVAHREADEGEETPQHRRRGSTASPEGHRVRLQGTHTSADDPPGALGMQRRLALGELPVATDGDNRLPQPLQRREVIDLEPPVPEHQLHHHKPPPSSTDAVELGGSVEDPVPRPTGAEPGEVAVTLRGAGGVSSPAAAPRAGATLDRQP
mmetsp:Transcript_38099/g.90516  ORF Transcript_38099/g.90516 Transcript_38099/m.90516 type:complete len:232 (-) Transcript_38099:1999-2694(-)